MAKACKIAWIPLIICIFLFMPLNAHAITNTQVHYDGTLSTGNVSSVRIYNTTHSQVGFDSFSSGASGDLGYNSLDITQTLYLVSSSGNHYLNGYLLLPYSITLTGSSAVSFKDIDISFIPRDGISLGTYANGKTTGTNAETMKYNVYVIFNNFLVNNRSTGDDIFDISIDYSALVSDGTSFSCNVVQSIGTISGTLNYGNPVSDEWLSSTIADAINNSSDINSILSLLSAISTNTSLISNVLSKVTDLDTKLANILTVLNNTYDQDEVRNTLLYAILTAISGSPELTDIADNTKAYWISIIQEALQIDVDKQDEIEDQQQDVADIISDNHNIEDDIFDNADSAFENVSFNIVSPSAISFTATYINNLIVRIYNNFGLGQWLITVTCTIGILIVVLGRFRLR